MNGDDDASPSPPLPNVSVFREMLRQSAEQLEVRKKELDSQERIRTLELEIQESSNRQGWDYAARALDVQAQDLREVRSHEARLMVYRLVAAVIIGLSGMGFIILLLRMGKDQLAADLVKVIGGFAAGGLAAYWFGKARGRAEAEREPRGETNSTVPTV